MKKRLMSLLFAGVMACSVMGSGVTTFAADNDSHINLALFTYIEGMDPATDWVRMEPYPLLVLVRHL